jgi:Ca2+-binding EF-hand superfamily protein
VQVYEAFVEIARAFAFFDADGGGFISMGEVHHLSHPI